MRFFFCSDEDFLPLKCRKLFMSLKQNIKLTFVTEIKQKDRKESNTRGKEPRKEMKQL